MAYYETINLVARDTKPEVNLTLKDSNTAAAGLTLDPDDSSTWAPIDLIPYSFSPEITVVAAKQFISTITR